MVLESSMACWPPSSRASSATLEELELVSSQLGFVDPKELSAWRCSERVRKIAPYCAR